MNQPPFEDWRACVLCLSCDNNTLWNWFFIFIWFTAVYSSRSGGCCDMRTVLIFLRRDKFNELQCQMHDEMVVAREQFGSILNWKMFCIPVFFYWYFSTGIVYRYCLSLFYHNIKILVPLLPLLIHFNININLQERVE